jgi:hypothetical protein
LWRIKNDRSVEVEDFARLTILQYERQEALCMRRLFEVARSSAFETDRWGILGLEVNVEIDQINLSEFQMVFTEAARFPGRRFYRPWGSLRFEGLVTECNIGSTPAYSPAFLGQIPGIIRRWEFRPSEPMENLSEVKFAHGKGTAPKDFCRAKGNI